MIDIVIGLSGAVLLVSANALFVVVEFALVTVDRTQVEILASEGNGRARRTLGLLRHLSFHLSGAQLGITISSLLLGFLIEPTVGRALQPLVARLGFVPEASSVPVSIGLALGLATATQMVAGELVPKNWAIARPLPTVLALASVVGVYGVVFGPVIAFLNGAADWTVRHLGIQPQEELRSVRSLEELVLVIGSSHESGTLDEEAASTLSRSIRFAQKRAADAIVPRGSVVAIPRTGTVADLASTALATGISRFPILGRDIHDVVGVVHAKDVFRVDLDDRPSTPVTGIMRQPLFVPETLDLKSLLLNMRQQGDQLAIVVDEHGSTAGIITLEDLLEEILGDIEDEYDPQELEPTLPVPPGTYLLEGGLHRDEIAEVVDFDMPEGPYHTLAGFLLALFGRIPQIGDRATYDGWEFEVVDRERLRIALVAVRPPPRGAEAG